MTGPKCGRKHGRSFIPCELPRGHDKPEPKGLRQRSPKQQAKESEWSRIKTRLMNRQRAIHNVNYCEACGKVTKQLDLHHVVARSQGGSFDEANASLRCRSCHQAEHGVAFPSTAGD